MKTRMIARLTVITVAFTMSFNAQDMFKATRLTTHSSQEGFATWSTDGGSIFFSRFSWEDTIGENGIWQIFLNTREVKQVFSGIAEHPKLSPDGRFIVFDSDTGAGMRMIETEKGIPKRFIPDSILIRSGGLPYWSPSGSHIAFKDATLSLCVYDFKTGMVTKIFREEGLVPLPGCWSRDGKNILFALMDRRTRTSTAWRISYDGKEKKEITGLREGFYRFLALSPDGSMLAYAAMEGKDLGLWIMPAEGGKSVPLAITHPGHNEGPAWSPDGKRLAFTSTRSGNFDIWMMDLDVDRLKKEFQTADR